MSLSPAHAEPIEITDIMGRQVTLAAPAKRVVLGAGRYLPVLGLIHDDPASITVAWRNDFLRDSENYDAWRAASPAVSDIPVVGPSAGSGLDVESVHALRPDLVVLALYDAEAAATTRAIDVLTALDIPVLVVDFFSHPLENSLPSLRMLGEALGRETEAEAFIDFYRQHIEAIHERLGGDLKRPSTFMHVHAGGMPCCSTPGHGVFNDMIEIAGGRNVALDNIPGLYGDVTLEQLFVDDPDIYIATGGSHLAARGGLVLGPGIDQKEARQSFDKLLATPGLAQLPAIQEGNAQAIWHMFNDSPVHIVMIERLAKIFHPELFADIDPADTLEKINRDFLAVPMEGTFWLEQ